MLRPQKPHFRRKRVTFCRTFVEIATLAGFTMTLLARAESIKHTLHRSGRVTVSSVDDQPAVPSSSWSRTSTIDLSGLHNLVGTPAWDDAIRIVHLRHQSGQKPRKVTMEEEILQRTSSEEEDAAVMAIDVSQSSLLDEHFDAMLRILFPVDDEDHPNNASRTDGDSSASHEALTLHLIAYGNQLTGGAVQTLVERNLVYEDRLNATARPDSNASDPRTDNHTTVSNDSGSVTSSEETDPSSPDTSAPRSSPTGGPSRHTSAIRRRIECLDLSWNPLFVADAAPMPKTRKAGRSSAGKDRRPRSTKEALQRLVTMPQLRVLRLDCCGLDPAHCRSLAKGLLDRYPASKVSSRLEASSNNETRSLRFRDGGIDKPRPFSLHLSGNGAVGDGGAAALAAALRTLVRRHKPESSSPAVVLETLDLSRCGIGDVGAEALAVALEARMSPVNCPALLIRRLDLSHNRITSVGAAALGRALRSAPHPGQPTDSGTAVGDVQLLGLDLSDNKDVGDKGATEIAGAVASGRLTCVSMRSCNVYADGAAAFGKALRRAAFAPYSPSVEVDLSGNPLGILRGKKKEDGKYSASRLKSKASATAASYVNQGMSFLRKNLKDVGVDVTPIFGTTSAESDDEEEKGAEDAVDDDYDPTKGRCGAKAMANAFIEASDEESAASRDLPPGAQISVGLRHCSFDHGAADALAAMLVTARQKLKLHFDVDVRLNSILEDEMVSALEGSRDFEHLLLEMAERHQDAVDALKEARARAAQASASAAARLRSRVDDEGDWETIGVGPNYDGDERDSDADYENDEDRTSYRWAAGMPLDATRSS